MVRDILAGVLASLALLALAGSGSVAAEEPTPTREAVAKGLEARRHAVRKLEDDLQATRAEVRGQLLDPLAAQRAATLRALKAFEAATLGRLEAEYAVQEYEKGIYPQDLATAEGEVDLARADLDRAREALASAVERRRPAMVEQLVVTEAEFGLEQARTLLQVLKSYTKAKETKKRAAALDLAKGAEEQCKAALATEQARKAKLSEQVARLRAKSPEDLASALIDDAVKAEDEAVALIREARAIEAQIRDEPAEADGLAAKLGATRDKVRLLMDRAKGQLIDALEVGEQGRAARARLRDAEANLRKEREILELLERDAAARA